MIRRFLFAATLAVAPFSAFAQSLGDVVSGTVLHGWRMENGHHMMAVRIALKPGWKTYWRAPGDAGIPPRFDWSGSRNVAAVAPHWPVPDVFVQNGLRSVGYEGEVIVPLEIRPRTDGAPIRVRARMDIGVCEEVCIPASLELAGDLTPNGKSDAPTIRTALADRPMSADEYGVGQVRCRAEPISDGLRLTVRIDMKSLGRDETAVIEFSDPSIWIAEPDVSRRGGTLTAVADMVPPDAGPFALSRDGVRITVLGRGTAVDIRGCSSG